MSEHGRFLLDQAEATAVFERTAKTVREQWRTHMQRAGVTERDCEAISSTFLCDGLLCGNAG